MPGSIFGMKRRRPKRSVIWKIPKKDLEDLVAKSQSISQVLSALGVGPVGGNHKTLKARLEAEAIECKHFNARKVQIDKLKEHRIEWKLEEILIQNSPFTHSSSLRKKLIKHGLLTQTCYICGIGPKWNDKPLILQIDHVNGDRKDNRLDNLRLLCPNCHSQTDTFAGRNNKEE